MCSATKKAKIYSLFFYIISLFPLILTLKGGTIRPYLWQTGAGSKWHTLISTSSHSPSVRQKNGCRCLIWSSETLTTPFIQLLFSRRSFRHSLNCPLFLMPLLCYLSSPFNLCILCSMQSRKAYIQSLHFFQNLALLLNCRYVCRVFVRKSQRY